jgi:glycosyltransferase involved in cell wall biosynthesis
MKPYLSVIIPAYNEAKRLPLTLIDMDKHLSKFDFSYEIIVINDGSKDSTAEMVKRFSQVIKNLRLINNAKNHGKGWVVRQAMLEAKGDVRLFMDSDNSVGIDQFSKMIPYLPSPKGEKGKYEIVIGSRDIPGAKLVPPQPWHKRIAGDMGNLFIQFLLLPGIWDTQCGFKAFTAEAAEKIFSKMKIEKWALDVEALSLAKKMGYKIKEIPVIWANDSASKVKLSSYIKFLLDVVKIRWWLTIGKYDGKLDSNGKTD